MKSVHATPEGISVPQDQPASADRVASRDLPDSAKAAPNASERRLRAIIETEPECMKIVSREGRLLEMNPAGLAMLEAASLEEVQRQPLLDFIVPEHRAAFADLHERVMGGESATLEFEIIGLKGARRWLETHAVPLKDESGGIQELLGVTRDITERRIMEQTLRESEERFRQLAENIREVFWLTDPAKNRMIYISPAYEGIWGRTCESLYASPRSWLDAIHPNDRGHVVDAAQKRQTRGDYDEEYRILRADGTVRWIRDRAFPVRDANGSVYRIAGIAEDITERKAVETALRESEQRFRQVAEQSPDAVLIHQEGRIVFVNEAMLSLMRAAGPEKLIGQSAVSLVHPDRVANVEERIRALYSGRKLPLSEQRYVRPDASTVDVEVAAAPFTLGGKPAALVTARDITARKEQEKRVARLTRIYAVLSAINSAIVRVRNREELFSEACRIIIQHGEFPMGWIGLVDAHSSRVKPVARTGSVGGLFEVARLSTDADSPEGLGPIGQAIHGKHPVVVNDISTHPRVTCRDEMLALGFRSAAFLPLITESGATGLLNLFAAEPGFFDEDEMRLLAELAEDISFAMDHIEKEERLHYLAYYDVLTGLPNRTLLHDRLAQYIHAAHREDVSTALILVDLERFHRVNETLGRSNADDVLREVAARLRRVVRAEDTVARVAGDRFAITLPGIQDSAEVAHFLRERVMPSLREPFKVSGADFRLAARFAVAIYPPDGDSPEALYLNAEITLKKAKERGERFLFYSPDMNARVAEALKLENKMRTALESQQFVLHYQPKLSLRDGRVTGVEALIRWRDSEEGLISPAKFIPILEETGLIVEVGQWALAQVARDTALWARSGLELPRVAVNVSTIQLRQPDFVRTVTEAAEQIGEAGGMLDLEITESTIMENVDSINRKLQTIRGLGVEIAVDDFGTGYSSLAYVARLPISALKIDRIFVAEIAQSEESRAVVRSVISLAQALRLHVVAEGVETEEQARELSRLGCEQMQGYLVARPLPAEEMADFLRQPHAAPWNDTPGKVAQAT
jgi:diguanylate cyclase (GGDEF)-like protein/PAS domain S-box-containing protein